MAKHDELKDVPTEQMMVELRLRGYRVCRKPHEAMRCVCGRYPGLLMRGGTDISEHYFYDCEHCGRSTSGKTIEEALRKWNKRIWFEEET